MPATAKQGTAGKPEHTRFAFGGNDKKLAKVDGDCYLIQFVLWLQVYCKDLITGNS